MRLREEHAAATRQAVLDSARRLFSSQGFSGTSIDQIAQAARVTKGAVYHHFKSKTDVFRAVYELLSKELEAQLRAQVQAAPPDARMSSAIDLLLLGADSEEVRTVLFRDGPAVLGGECRAIDQRHYLGLAEQTLLELQSQGVIRPVDTRVFARLLLAALVEGSIMLGNADHVETTRAALRAALEHMLAGLYVNRP